MTPRKLATYAAHSAASGVLGWLVLMAIFEGAYLADCYRHRRRK